MALTDPLEVVREDIVSACHILSGEKLAGSFGHVSARTADGGQFGISARMSLAAIDNEHVELLPVGCAVLPEHGSIPIEAFIHSAIYADKPDVNAIMRTHSESCSVLGLLHRHIRPIHALGAIVEGEVPIYGPCELVTSAPLGKSISDAMRGAPAIVLRGNGVIVVGSSVEEACVRSIYLEESARYQLLALMAGSPEIEFLSEHESSRALADLGTPSQIRRSWEHFKRLHP